MIAFSLFNGAWAYDCFEPPSSCSTAFECAHENFSPVIGATAYHFASTSAASYDPASGIIDFLPDERNAIIEALNGWSTTANVGGGRDFSPGSEVGARRRSSPS